MAKLLATRWLPGWRGGSSPAEAGELRGAARRGLADGCAVDDPPGWLLRGALG